MVQFFYGEDVDLILDMHGINGTSYMGDLLRTDEVLSVIHSLTRK
jgi:hypothetical protein